MAAQACVCVFCVFVSKFESKFALIEKFCVFCEVCVRQLIPPRRPHGRSVVPFCAFCVRLI